jgi:hypothetical protein
MMGIRYTGSNVALVESCDERPPDADIIYEGSHMKWSKYV